MHLVSGPQISHVTSQWNHSVDLLRRPLAPSSSSPSSSFHHPLIIILLHIASYLIFFGSANSIRWISTHDTIHPVRIEKNQSKVSKSQARLQRDSSNHVQCNHRFDLSYLASFSCRKVSDSNFHDSSRSDICILGCVFFFSFRELLQQQHQTQPGTTHFYFTHLTLHAVPFLYRHVHRHHHESTNPGLGVRRRFIRWRYVVFEREARNFSNFLFNILNITRISHSYRARKSLENQRSNVLTKTRTPIRRMLLEIISLFFFSCFHLRSLNMNRYNTLFLGYAIDRHIQHNRP